MAYDGGSNAETPTLAEIKAAGLGVLASCACGHARTLDVRRVCAPPATDVTALGDLLACSKCGTKGLATRVAPLPRAQ